MNADEDHRAFDRKLSDLERRARRRGDGQALVSVCSHCRTSARVDSSARAGRDSTAGDGAAGAAGVVSGLRLRPSRIAAALSGMRCQYGARAIVAA